MFAFHTKRRLLAVMTSVLTVVFNTLPVARASPSRMDRPGRGASFARFGSYGSIASAVQQMPSALDPETKNKMAAGFAPMRNLLIREGVPFEPNELLEPGWPLKLWDQLYSMPQLRKDRTVKSGHIAGLYLARTLDLPEKMKGDGDILILARRLIFRGPHVEIIAPGHNVYVFPVETQEKDFKKSEYRDSEVTENGLGTAIQGGPSVYIRTGARPLLDSEGKIGRDSCGKATDGLCEDGVSGANGLDDVTPPPGKPPRGTVAATGRPGICGVDPAGRRGERGDGGLDGDTGAKGRTGRPGAKAGDISYTVNT
ncbi:MAG TPA: hypothetical protein VJX67_03880, partial [Blastocatellia bacterium]|nr:hypothetical protein [Blastocatellia bacterium]